MWNAIEKPSMRFSNSGSIASGVTSRPVKPVPPVVITTSMPASAIQRRIVLRIASKDGPGLATLRGSPKGRAPQDDATNNRLQRPAAERVAGLHGALLVAGHEPALALFGRTVREGIRHDASRGLALQRVVADRAR